MGLFSKDTKKTLIKEFKELIDDIMDNYDKYNDNERTQVKNALEKLQNLNSNLDKYDPKMQNAFDKVKKAFRDFFGG